MPDEKLASSLQQSVLAALCFDVPFGAEISVQVQPDHFDGVYRDFAARVLTYRRRYGRPPGPNHIADIAAQATFGRDDSPVVKRLIPNLLAERDSLNAEYAATRVQEFIRRQVYKGAIVEAGDRYGQDDDRMLDDLERIFGKALRFRQKTLSSGTFLTDPKILSSLDRRHVEFLPLGIPELDRRGIGPAPKKLLLYIAPKGAGKSWFCVHVGKQAIMQRLRVAHITNEMDESEVLPRYLQSLFGVADTPDRTVQTVLEFDDILQDKLIGFKTKYVKPKLNFNTPGIKKILRSKIGRWGTRIGGLVVKEFATSTLTIDQLVGYLDYLEEVENFVPNVLIVDYPKLMKSPDKDIRIGIGRNVEGIRGICGERNMAGVTPHQGTRATIGARRVRSNQAGEDISVVQTADIVLAFSRTEAEERLGLGRLSVEHVRHRRGGGLMLLLTQSYETGQYVLDSAVMQKAYWEKLKEVAGGEDDGEDD